MLWLVPLAALAAEYPAPEEGTFIARDSMYQWDSSRDYNASPGLPEVEAPLPAVNAPDDERNPPETGEMEREMKRVKNSRLYLIPASERARGHRTTGMAKLWKQQQRDFLQSVPC